MHLPYVTWQPEVGFHMKHLKCFKCPQCFKCSKYTVAKVIHVVFVSLGQQDDPPPFFSSIKCATYLWFLQNGSDLYYVREFVFEKKGISHLTYNYFTIAGLGKWLSDLFKVTHTCIEEIVFFAVTRKKTKTINTGIKQNLRESRDNWIFCTKLILYVILLMHSFLFYLFQNLKILLEFTLVRKQRIQELFSQIFLLGDPNLNNIFYL